jgi:hypothetical protein
MRSGTPRLRLSSPVQKQFSPIEIAVIAYSLTILEPILELVGDVGQGLLRHAATG